MGFLCVLAAGKPEPARFDALSECAPYTPGKLEAVQFTNTVSFFVAALLTTVILALVPLDDARVAITRVAQRVDFVETLRQEAAVRCSQLVPSRNTPEERRLGQLVAPRRGEGPGTVCRLEVLRADSTRFGLRTDTQVGATLIDEKGRKAYSATAKVSYPRPLVLLPLLLSLLSIVFGFRRWSGSFTAASFVLLLFGGNLVDALRHLARGTWTLVRWDTGFGTLALVLLWLALALERPKRSVEGLSEREEKPNEDALMPKPPGTRLLSGLVGVGSPVLFAAFGPLWIATRRSLEKAAGYFDAQVVLAAASLYILIPGAASLGDVLERSVLVPRYLAFAALVFLLYHRLERPRSTSPSTVAPGRLLLVVGLTAVAETAFRYLLPEFPIPSSFRIGAFLVGAELFPMSRSRAEAVAKRYFPWFAAALAAAFVDLAARDAGLTDTILSMLDPRAHPNAAAIFTFACGWVLGFSTGALGTAYFALALPLKGFGDATVRAALFDGILAGALLSPISLFNVLPAVQFGIGVRRLVAYRWRQLAIPMLIAGIIYVVASVRTMAILQPVTFVMLVLTALAVQMQMKTWDLERFRYFKDGRTRPGNKPAEAS